MQKGKVPPRLVSTPHRLQVIWFSLSLTQTHHLDRVPFEQLIGIVKAKLELIVFRRTLSIDCRLIYTKIKCPPPPPPMMCCVRHIKKNIPQLAKNEETKMNWKLHFKKNVLYVHSKN